MTAPLKPQPSIEDWLEETAPSTHICSRCRTPWGRSALPCPNDPKYRRRLGLPMEDK